MTDKYKVGSSVTYKGKQYTVTGQQQRGNMRMIIFEAFWQWDYILDMEN